MELGFALAQRLELAEAQTVAHWASEHMEAGGGIVSFGGPTSPISHAVGVGMKGPVTLADLDRIEEFYGTRGAPVNLDLCPLADVSLMENLGHRGYRITEFNNVLVRPLDPMPEAEGVRIAADDERDQWTRTMLAGFFEKDSFTADELQLGASLFAIPGAGAFWVDVGGTPAAAAAGCVIEKLLFLFGDSTLEAFRRRGLHRKLIDARLAWAHHQGAELAWACTLPGSNSQRNYERAGFRIAYTKMNMCLGA